MRSASERACSDKVQREREGRASAVRYWKLEGQLKQHK